MKVVPFQSLEDCNLIVDAVYEGGSSGNAGDDPISKLMPGSGNQGGFRASGQGEKKNFVVLYTSGENRDWPDRIDLNTGQFVYYGDNKTPGHELHDTRPGVTRSCAIVSINYILSLPIAPLFRLFSYSANILRRTAHALFSSKA